MMDSEKETPLIGFVTKAVKMKAFKLNVEYKDGENFISAISGNTGLGIGRIKSRGDESRLLLEELYTILENKKKVIVLGRRKYELRVEIYEDFGEDGFDVAIKKKGPYLRMKKRSRGKKKKKK